MSKSKKKPAGGDDDNDDVGQLDDGGSLSVDSVMSLVSEANGFVQGGAALRGLQLLVNNPPVTLKENQPKEAAAEVAVRALSLIKDADMSKALNELSDDQLNNCLKYVYWGLSTGQNSASMLKWHASLVDKLGVGSICRVLSEKKVADNKILA